MNIFRVVGSSLALSAVATVFGTQGTSGGNEPNSSTPTLKFDAGESQKLVKDLYDDNYRTTRGPAYTKLLFLSNNLPFDEFNNFFNFILKETIKEHPLEVNTRLGTVQKEMLKVLRQTIVNQTESSKKTEITLRLIEVMNKNRAPHIWNKLMSTVTEFIEKEATINETYYDEDTNQEHTQKRSDPQLTESLSKLLLSTFDKDSKELQKEAGKLIASLTKGLLREQGTFISWYNMNLKALSELPENKLNEIEVGLKELKELYLQANLSSNLETRLAYLAKPHLEKILEKNVDFFSINDPKKQSIGINNINILKDLFIYTEVKHVISTKNGANILKERQEFSKNITNANELLSTIKIAEFTSKLGRNDFEYHKSYINWLEKQIDNIALQKLSDREEIENILESTLMKELSTVANSGRQGHFNVETRLQIEIINPLIKAYTKLARQSNLNSNYLRKNLQAIVDFQLFSYWDVQEKVHADLLDLFDTVTKKINEIQDAKDKASLRMEIVLAMPRSPNPDFSKGYKDYVNKLSNFYCKEQNHINIDEFMRLVHALLNSPDSKHVGEYLPPEIMLGFIESNTKYFERNIQYLIEMYKKSNEPAVKSASREQLQKLYFSFHCLFNERQKAATENGYLTQYYPHSRLVHQPNWGMTNLRNYPEWVEQISRIEKWFNQELGRAIHEIISLKEPANATT